MIYLLLALVIMLVAWSRWLKKADPQAPPELERKLPIIGHAYLVLGNSVDMFNGIKKISHGALKNGGVCRFNLGPRMFYGVVDPEDCLTVATACLQKHYIYNFAEPLFANGILNADVETWKKHRRLLNPAFSQQVLDGFIDIFNTQARTLVEDFSKEVGHPFDQEAYLRIRNLEIICATSFGAQPEEYGQLQKEYLPLLEEVLHVINIRIQKFWLHTDFLFNLSPLKKKQDVVVKNLDKFSDLIVQKKKTEIKTRNSGNISGKLKPFIDLITELSAEHPSLTDRQIRGETSTIIAGGHDTTASALTFALVLLGSDPRVQEKAYQEILQVVGESKTSISKEDMSNLVYIDAVVKESIRLYPSVPVIARQLDEDIKLKNCTLRACYGCVISIYGANRHPMWGPDAEEFRPERWFEKDSLPEPKYQSSFGLGRRSCIGKTYGMMAMKITLTHILRAYVISSDISKLVIKMDTMIRPAEGFHITVVKRQ